jgi:hypothetical protein
MEVGKRRAKGFVVIDAGGCAPVRSGYCGLDLAGSSLRIDASAQKVHQVLLLTK